jgi:hypothetical protein
MLMLPGAHLGGCSLTLSRTALNRRGLVLMLFPTAFA